MNRPAAKPCIILTLEALPSGVPVANRLRSILKRLLRQYGFKCVHVDGDGLQADETARPSTAAKEPL